MVETVNAESQETEGTAMSQSTESTALPKRNKRGRPKMFTGHIKRHIVSIIRKHGLTGGRTVLAEEGTKVSLPTLGKLAAEAGVELHRGRPKAA